MNEIEKAIDYFKNAHIDYSRVEDGIKAQKVCDMAITALEHQLPKKPTGTEIPYCPHCNKVFVTSNDDYCHRCGGKIDRSDKS